MEADQQCGYLRTETIIWKEEILPLIFYITLELTLTQLDKLHAAATAQLDSITPFTSWLQQNPVMTQQP